MSNFIEKNIFTTGQVAKICQVAPRTVTKWFDSGQLKGYRIPGSQDRRIPRNSLVYFLSSNGMPLGELGDPIKSKVLVLSEHNDLEKSLVENYESVDVKTVHTTFDIGAAVVAVEPHCVVLDTLSLTYKTQSLVSGLRGVLNKNSSIIGLLPENATDELQDLFDESFRAPCDQVLVCTRIENLAQRAKS